MKYFKSHFWYHKNQRNGIFLLTILILILQSIIFFGTFSLNQLEDVSQLEIIAFQKKIDSLKEIEIKDRRPKIFPFNPNYISDYKGAQLGMSVIEIDRLFLFRKTNKFITSKQEFQRITKVSDSLLVKIAPYFKFPEWVTKKRKLKTKSKTASNELVNIHKKKSISSIDINKASAEDFKTIYGIGEKLSERIIKYRSKLQGFSFESQIKEVWGLEEETVEKVLSIFKIIEKPTIRKININTVTFKELLNTPYIDFALCKKIFEYRDEIAAYQNISELKNIKDFPLGKYDRIVLYLMAE
jgi:competence ComEA-like helix-hairpin-helix protein